MRRLQRPAGAGDTRYPVALSGRRLPRIPDGVEGRGHSKAKLQLNGQNQRLSAHEFSASRVLRAVTEYISTVIPVKIRLMPRIVPIAHAELDGQGRTTR